MMRWILLGLSSLGCIFALSLLLGHTEPLPLPPPAPTHPAPHQSELYDSIRTNLDDYLWPTDAGRILTSSFGEYRRTHFHAGIDIGTGDVTGYRVFASRNGFISRIIVEPVGYGKMLYVQHSDGYTTTYSHLRGFSALIEKRVVAEQLRLERFPVDIRCAPGEYPVRKGEVIAFTGETGSGSPHLHFEIRDENLNAVNPLLGSGMQFPDGVPPTVRRVAIVPVGPGSKVNGEPEPLLVRVRQQGPRTFLVTNPMSITGEAGIALYVRDNSDGTYYSHGVYRHTLYVDGNLHAEVRLDRAPMRESHQIGLYYVRSLLQDRAGRFEKLYVDSRHTIPFFQPSTKGSGLLSTSTLTPGKHTFTVISQDFSGNSAEVTGTFTLDPLTTLLDHSENGVPGVRTLPPGSVQSFLLEGKGFYDRTWQAVPVNVAWDETRSSAMFALGDRRPDILRVRSFGHAGQRTGTFIWVLNPRQTGSSTVRISSGITRYGIEVALSSDGVFTSPPMVTVEEGNRRRTVPLEALDENHYHAVIVPDVSTMGRRSLVYEGSVNGAPARATHDVDLYPLLPGQRGEIRLANGQYMIRYDSLSVYDTLYLHTRVDEMEGVLELLPERATLRNGIQVFFRSAEADSHLALYTRGSGEWSLLESSAPGPDGYITARLSRWLGSVALLRDDEAPFITNLRIRRLPGRRISASFRASDTRSGVDYEGLKTYIDGAFVIPDIDGEHRKTTVHAPGPLTRGSHRLTIRLQDRSGNVRIVERQFVVS